MRYHGGFHVVWNLELYLFDRPVLLERSPPPWLCGSITNDLRSNAINDHATDNQYDQNPAQNHVHGTPHPLCPPARSSR